MSFEAKQIHNQIYAIRGVHVMLDRDLAMLYQVETKVLNQAVKRNLLRFPETFRFQLSEMEAAEIKTIKAKSHLAPSRSQIVTLNGRRGQNIKYLPYAFTEQGIAMLSAVLHSDKAIRVSINIMEAFAAMRKFLMNHASIFRRLDEIELKQFKTDERMDHIFKTLEKGTHEPEKGIFFDGQIFDAWLFISELIKKAKKEIILVDNYIDETVLVLLSKRKKNVAVTIYTKPLSKQLKLDVAKYHAQYPGINIHTIDISHDRFLLIDQRELYHIGASLKDLGKKWFAFSKMDGLAGAVLQQLKLLV